MTIRTYDEQKAHEREERRLWVQSLADTYGTIAQAADSVETTFHTLRHLATLHGVKFNGPKRRFSVSAAAVNTYLEGAAK